MANAVMCNVDVLAEVFCYLSVVDQKRCGALAVMRCKPSTTLFDWGSSTVALGHTEMIPAASLSPKMRVCSVSDELLYGGLHLHLLGPRKDLPHCKSCLLQLSGSDPTPWTAWMISRHSPTSTGLVSSHSVAMLEDFFHSHWRQAI